MTHRGGGGDNMEGDEEIKVSNAAAVPKNAMENVSENVSKIDYTPGPNSIDVSPDKDGKVWKEIEKAGVGKEVPTPGVEVQVQYIGALTDGTEFDRSSPTTPFQFQLGKKSVIGGWEAAVATMTKGEVAKVFIHPDLGYGKAGSPPKIPPNATLVFDIELMDWKYEDLSVAKDGGILRKVIQAGPSRYYHPNDGATVQISLVGFQDGKEFIRMDNVEFVLGEGCEVGICRGVEEALLKIPEGETCRVMIKAKYGYNAAESRERGIPPDADLEFEVTLFKFTKGKEVWSLDGPQKMECAREFKEKAFTFLSKKKYALAALYYKKIEEFLKMEALLDGELEEERKQLMISGHLNASHCYLQVNQFIPARHEAEKALAMDSRKVKGWYRKGMANLGLKEPVEAKSNFQKMLELDETCAELASKRINEALQMIKQDTVKEKDLYAKMLGIGTKK